MNLHSLRTDTEISRDDLVGLPGNDELHHLSFPRGEVGEQCGKLGTFDPHLPGAAIEVDRLANEF